MTQTASAPWLLAPLQLQEAHDFVNQSNCDSVFMTPELHVKARASSLLGNTMKYSSSVWLVILAR